MSLIKGPTYIQCPQQVMINTQKRWGVSQAEAFS